MKRFGFSDCLEVNFTAIILPIGYENDIYRAVMWKQPCFNSYLM